jgi:hypothetical protein
MPGAVYTVALVGSSIWPSLPKDGSRVALNRRFIVTRPAKPVITLMALLWLLSPVVHAVVHAVYDDHDLNWIWDSSSLRG